MTGERPAALWAHDHHSLWLNGAALRATGLDRDRSAPEGGVIERDADGAPTGIVRERAAWALPLPEPDARERRRAVEAAQRDGARPRHHRRPRLRAHATASACGRSCTPTGG